MSRCPVPSVTCAHSSECEVQSASSIEPAKVLLSPFFRLASLPVFAPWATLPLVQPNPPPRLNSSRLYRRVRRLQSEL
jgi:hypothetical protein